MKQTNFKPQASYCESMFSSIDICIPEGTEDFVYHRYSYLKNDRVFNPSVAYGKVCKSKIRYAKPSWSSELEPYFIRYGIRYYLSNFIINR